MAFEVTNSEANEPVSAETSVYIVPYSDSSYLIGSRPSKGHWFYQGDLSQDVEGRKVYVGAREIKKAGKMIENPDYYCVYRTGKDLSKWKNPGQNILIGGSLKKNSTLFEVAEAEFIAETGLHLQELIDMGELDYKKITKKFQRRGKKFSHVFYAVYIGLSVDFIPGLQGEINNRIQGNQVWMNNIVKTTVTTITDDQRPQTGDEELTSVQLVARTTPGREVFPDDETQDWFQAVVAQIP